MRRQEIIKCAILLCNNSATVQFDDVMSETNWPNKVCTSIYKLDLSNKILPSYCIVIQNAPS